VNYYEVAFKYDTKIYRSRWRTGETGKLAVPFGNYTAVGPGASPAAIMFAGRYDTKTLLAVGKLTTGTANITTTTTGVTFELTPLTAGVAATNTSSFSVGGVTPSATVTVDGVSVPISYVNLGANTATYTIGGLGTLGAGVFVQAMTASALSTESVPSLIASSQVPGFVLDPSTIAPSSGAVSATSGVFTFTLNVPATTIGVATKGLSKLSFNIPVRAMDQTEASGDIWYLRGGIKNTEYDLGAGTHSLGAAILLGTADIAGDVETIQIEIGGSIPPP